MSDDPFQDLEEQCVISVEHFRKDISKLRGGRASASLIESVQVDYYGTMTPLQQLGLINAPEPRMLTIQVYDSGALDSVEKALLQADLGLNPARDGNLIRLNIPALTEERRKELVKKLHKISEESKVAIRNHRRAAIDVLKKQEKDKEITEDDLHRGQDEIQKVTDKHIKEVDELLKEKEQEMMEV